MLSMESDDEIVTEYINGYKVMHNDSVWVFLDNYDSMGEENIVYRVQLDDEVNQKKIMAKTKNGMNFSMYFDIEHPFSPNDIKSNGTIVGANGVKVVFTDNAVTQVSLNKRNLYIVRTYNDDSKIENVYDKEGGTLLYERHYDNANDLEYEINVIDNVITYYNNDIQYCCESADGSKAYVYDEETSLIIYKDGTYSKDDEKGTYVIDSNGNIICTDEDNNRNFYDKYGHKFKLITNDGIVYDYDNDSQIITKSGVARRSRINHIEYDEEAYDTILNTLNEVSSSKGRQVTSNLSGVDGNIRQFPDTYNGDFAQTESDVENHIELIKSLKEMTNYSLLVYQTCDENLKDGLVLLVDSLFGDSNPVLAANFKGMINNIIEKQKGILGYKEGVDFATLAQSAIVKSTYTDKDGNKWYLSGNDTVVGLEGNNFKVNYGGETFSLTYDADGVIKLIDSKGNNLNIFGDYNTDSTQYGSNQMVIQNSYYNPYINAMLTKYFSNATTEEKDALLHEITQRGCGYAAITNMVFKELEGDESKFYKTYGFPMYTIKKDGEDLMVDYNYEPVIFDLFYQANSNEGRNNIEAITTNATGVGEEQIVKLNNYLKKMRGVTLGNVIGADNIVTDNGEYTIYYPDGNLRFEGSSAHMMIITEQDNDTIYVSTWGEKRMYGESDNEKYRKTYDSIWRKVLNGNK